MAAAIPFCPPEEILGAAGLAALLNTADMEAGETTTKAINDEIKSETTVKAAEETPVG